MSFNYLQTDDRDDYFSQFDKKRKRKKYDRIIVIDKELKLILNNVIKSYAKRWTKRTFEIKGNIKYTWQQELKSRGYIVVNVPN